MRRLSDVMAWLDAGVPVTLLVDLLDPAGPNSKRILEYERPAAAELEWLTAFTGHVAARAEGRPALA